MKVDKLLARDKWVDFDFNWNFPVHYGHVMCDNLNLCIGSRAQSVHVWCQSCGKPASGYS